jgi:hypothetical protein
MRGFKIRQKDKIFTKNMAAKEIDEKSDALVGRVPHCKLAIFFQKDPK